MAKTISNKRPDNFWKTLRNLLHYMGNHRFLLLLVAILVAISALANLLGTYMLKPIVNEYIVPRDVQGLFFAVAGDRRYLWRRRARLIWLYTDHGRGRAEDHQRDPGRSVPSDDDVAVALL